MKKLLRADSPPSEVYTVDDDNTDEKNNKYDFTYFDLVNILREIEELRTHDISIVKTKSGLQLLIGNSAYEFLDPNNKSYPPRRLRKLET